MEISPIKMLWLVLCSLGFGAVCGGINDLFRLSRAVLGVRYCKKTKEIWLPPLFSFLNKACKSPKDGPLKRISLGVMVFFQDILLFFIAGAGGAVISYYFNYGRVRIYAPLFIIIGGVLYFVTVGRVTVKTFDTLASLIRGIVTAFLSLFYLPISFFVKFLVKNGKILHKKLNKAIAKKQKVVYNNNKVDFVRKNARVGFIKITESKR